MHLTALNNGKLFFENYLKGSQLKTVIDIGAQNINGSLKDVLPEGLSYLGVDFVPGNGVDVVLDDPYVLPFENDSVEAIVCSSVLEHSELFWLLFLEIIRVLKPNGLFYLNVPSNGMFHRYPVDCWRFYPDSANALITWAKRNGYSPALLESFISEQSGDGWWNDFVAVFVKDEKFASEYPQRMISSKNDFTNGTIYGGNEFIKPSPFPEDQQKMVAMEVTLKNLQKGWSPL